MNQVGQLEPKPAHRLCATEVEPISERPWEGLGLCSRATVAGVSACQFGSRFDSSHLS